MNADCPQVFEVITSSDEMFSITPVADVVVFDLAAFPERNRHNVGCRTVQHMDARRRPRCKRVVAAFNQLSLSIHFTVLQPVKVFAANTTANNGTTHHLGAETVLA